MTKLQWMKFYPNDWLNDTRSLSPLAKGCWIDLICLMWNASLRGQWEGTLEELSRAVGIEENQAQKVFDELCLRVASGNERYHNVTNRYLGVTIQNRRMLKEGKRYEYNAIKQKEYRERKKRYQKVNSKTPRLKDLKTPEDLKTTSNTIALSRFEIVWSKYPNPKGKKAALRHFVASVKSEQDFNAIKAALTNYVRYCDGKELQYVQHGSTWFNNWAEWVNPPLTMKVSFNAIAKGETNAIRNSESVRREIPQLGTKKRIAENGGFTTPGMLLRGLRYTAPLQSSDGAGDIEADGKRDAEPLE